MGKLRIGLIGAGFMGRAHSNAYRQVNRFFDLEHQPELKAVCSRDGDKAEAFAARWGYQSHETDWRRLVERDDIDAKGGVPVPVREFEEDIRGRETEKAGIFSPGGELLYEGEESFDIAQTRTCVGRDGLAAYRCAVAGGVANVQQGV